MKSYKIVLTGDSSVGKTSLVSRFVYKKFIEHNSSTIGASFISYTMDNMRLNIWDTAGQERYRSLVSVYYRSVDYCLIVFDINQYTIDGIKYWINEYLSMSDNTNFVLVGNKDDTYDNNDIPEDIEILINIYKIKFFRTSAYSGKNVDDVFKHVADMINLKKDKLEEIVDIDIKVEKENKCIDVGKCM